jgi:hypothetical protein
MGRQSLRLTMLLGVLITAIGATGIFAAFTDRATTGTNSAQTAPRPSAVDLRISVAAEPVPGVPVNCDGDLDTILFEDDDLTTGIFAATNLQPGGGGGQSAYVCLASFGSGTIDVSATAIDVVDTDVDCTGDEAAAGDTTCGSGQLGELSGALVARIRYLDCATGLEVGIVDDVLANWVVTPLPVTSALAPQGIVCLRLTVFVAGTTPEATVQLIQSDKVEWRFAFDAALAP